MTFQEFDQDDDCGYSILVTEGGGPGGDGPDWQPSSEGISASVFEVFTKIMWKTMCIVWISPIFQKHSVQNFKNTEKYKEPRKTFIILSFGKWHPSGVPPLYSTPLHLNQPFQARFLLVQ